MDGASEKPMGLKLKELAALVGGETVGDPELVIERVAPIESAQPGEITFVANRKYIPLLRETKASAIIVSPEFRRLQRNLIVAQNPYLAFARAVGALMEEKPPRVPGVHPSATVSDNAQLGRNLLIGPHVTIEDGATIADNVTLMAGVFIGRGASVGEETVIHANAVVYHGVTIGKRCTIHANVALGSYGFGWAPDGLAYEAIPQVGATIIGDDVSIGANSVVNRGTLGNTTVGSGTKIDSLVILSHNVEVGENCLFVSQVGISGTVQIGSHCTFGGQVGVAGHLTIGDNVQIAAQSGVSHHLESNGTYFGSPARPIREMRRAVAAFRKLPELRDEIKHVQKRMSEITALLDRDVGDMTKQSKSS